MQGVLLATVPPARVDRTTMLAPMSLAMRAAAPAGVVAGLAMIVVGTFLPWLTSGQVDRNSYVSDGLLRELLRIDGLRGAVLTAWPFLAVVCALAAALVLLGRTRAGSALAVVPCAAAGVVSITALERGAGGAAGLVHVARSGPLTTLIGAAVTLAAVLVCFAVPRTTIGRDR